MHKAAPLDGIILLDEAAKLQGNGTTKANPDQFHQHVH
jgi:hypothetical protein